MGILTDIKEMCDSCPECKDCALSGKPQGCRYYVFENEDEVVKIVEDWKKTKRNKNRLFLLSKNEYNSYKNLFPHQNWWWLRDNYNDHYVSFVTSDGSTDYYSAYACYGGIRPAFKSDFILFNQYKIGDSFTTKGNVWVKVDDEFFVSKYIVKLATFDRDGNTDYEKASIRAELKKLEKELFSEEELKVINYWE